VKATTPKQVLIAAKWILENKGWCQHHFGLTKNGKNLSYTQCRKDLDRACLVGAIGVIDAESPIRVRAEQAVLNLLPGISISHWNDELGRTKQQVLDLLDRVIEELPNE
jgi:hypothetical protein